MRATLLVLLFAAAPFAAGLAVPSAPAPACVDPADRPGVGPSCVVDGGYALTLPDGQVVLTHGPDPAPTLLAPAVPLAPPRAPACVEPAIGQRHHLVIYARPADKPDRGDAFRDELRGMVATANGLLDLEAKARGAPGLDYRMACVDGEVRIDTVVLPLASGGVGESSVDFYRVTAAIRALGYVDPFAKYWIWYDDQLGCACAGVAESAADQARIPRNGANGGPTYAVTFGYTGDTGAFVLMHENGHTMGAVSNMAPASSGAGHCNDGLDVMCYADGGPRSTYSPSVCADRARFDCGQDTYFDARPSPTEYLGRRWNLAAPLNRFVQGCLYAQPSLLQGESASIDLTASCAGGLFAAMGEPSVPVPGSVTLYVAGERNDVDVCWYADATLLRCDTAGYFHEGSVPAGATRAVVTKVAGEDPRVLLSIV